MNNFFSIFNAFFHVLTRGNHHFPRDADEDEYDESEYDPPPIARETLIEMLSDEWQPLQIADRLSTKESGFCIRLEERGKDQGISNPALLSSQTFVVISFFKRGFQKT